MYLSSLMDPNSLNFYMNDITRTQVNNLASSENASLRNICNTLVMPKNRFSCYLSCQQFPSLPNLKSSQRFRRQISNSKHLITYQLCLHLIFTIRGSKPLLILVLLALDSKIQCTDGSSLMLGYNLQPQGRLSLLLPSSWSSKLPGIREGSYGQFYSHIT